MEGLTQALPDLGYLPRGRHHLTREQVVATQRGRMLLGMAESVAVKGYAATTVADVISRAGTSRETFYQQFRNKQDCFLAAYDECVRVMLEAVTGAILPDDATPIERLRGILGAYLEMMTNEPALARTFLIDVYAAGPDALQKRVAVQRQFAEMLAAAFVDEERLAGIPDLPFACEMFVAAVSAVVTARLIESRDLIALREPIFELLDTFVSSQSR